MYRATFHYNNILNLIYSVRTPQKAHVSTTELNRLILFGETVGVCCENRTEHSPCGHNAEWKPCYRGGT
jgi:hypothetical protein